MALRGPGVPSKGMPRSRARACGTVPMDAAGGGAGLAATAVAPDSAMSAQSRARGDRVRRMVPPLVMLIRGGRTAAPGLAGRASPAASDGTLAPMPRSRLPILAVVMLFVWALAAPSLAAEEKKLFIYNWTDFIGPDTVAQFEKL